MDTKNLGQAYRLTLGAGVVAIAAAAAFASVAIVNSRATAADSWIPLALLVLVAAPFLAWRVKEATRIRPSHFALGVTGAFAASYVGSGLLFYSAALIPGARFLGKLHWIGPVGFGTQNLVEVTIWAATVELAAGVLAWFLTRTRSTAKIALAFAVNLIAQLVLASSYGLFGLGWAIPVAAFATVFITHTRWISPIPIGVAMLQALDYFSNDTRGFGFLTRHGAGIAAVIVVAGILIAVYLFAVHYGNEERKA